MSKGCALEPQKFTVKFRSWALRGQTLLRWQPEHQFVALKWTVWKPRSAITLPMCWVLRLSPRKTQKSQRDREEKLKRNQVSFCGWQRAAKGRQPRCPGKWVRYEGDDNDLHCLKSEQHKDLQDTQSTHNTRLSSCAHALRSADIGPKVLLTDITPLYISESPCRRCHLCNFIAFLWHTSFVLCALCRRVLSPASVFLFKIFKFDVCAGGVVGKSGTPVCSTV